MWIEVTDKSWIGWGSTDTWKCGYQLLHICPNIISILLRLVFSVVEERVTCVIHLLIILIFTECVTAIITKIIVDPSSHQQISVLIVQVWNNLLSGR